MSVIQLLLAEKKTERRIKVRLNSEDRKYFLKLFKKNFRVVNWGEVNYELE